MRRTCFILGAFALLSACQKVNEVPQEIRPLSPDFFEVPSFEDNDGSVYLDDDLDLPGDGVLDAKNKPPAKENKNSPKDSNGLENKTENFSAVVSTLCPRFLKSPAVIQIEDPMRVFHYDLEMLGIVEIAVSPQTRVACIEAALKDGAEILLQDDHRLRLFYPTRLESFLDDAKERLNVSAVEGRWSESLGRIIPGIAGRELNVPETRKVFFDAVERELPAFSLVVDSKPALSSDLSQVKNFKPTVLIGEYTTHFSKSVGRSINVRLAASALDGIFLMPGAEFSYNAWVGERSEARGYKEAPVIENGELVEGLGGGACQVSSTVHAASLMSGLEIIERSNHSLPSSYIPKGLDAVVSYPILDLRVKNTRTRPVVLRISADKDNNLTAQYFSDEPSLATIEFKGEVVSEIPFKEVVTVDPSLYSGVVRVRKQGKNGFRVQRSLIIHEHGIERVQKLGMDTYIAQPKQVSIGPGTDYVPGKAD